MSYKRLAVVFLAPLCGFGLYVALLSCPNPFDPLDGGIDPSTGKFVGKTKASILRRFGEPSHQWEGHYGAPSWDYASQHSPAVTFMYERWTGIHYLSFELVDGEWVCFRSSWMPNGWAH
jgi:hypothetical protein